MKKFAFLMIAIIASAFISCGKTDKVDSNDSTSVDSTIVEDTLDSIEITVVADSL